MKYRIQSEDEILNPEVRKRILDEIQAPENISRREEAERRTQVYRDNTIEYVAKKLEKEGLKPHTLEQMLNRAANISILKKIINKLARVYVGGVKREFEDDASQMTGDELASQLYLDTKMKKSDRFRELYKNMMLQVVPEYVYSDGDQPKFKLKLKTLNPMAYDVVEDYQDPEIPRVIIMTHFDRKQDQTYGGINTEFTRGKDQLVLTTRGNSQDEFIADRPEDQGADCKEAIWWSDKYHFTTDLKGNILKEKSPEDLLNPIQMKPFVNVTDDQDGHFWALGGDDLVDGAILINTMLTDMFSIAYIQGWGQMVITGKGIPKLLEGGPHNAMILEANSGEPEPKVSYVSANPPLQIWMQAIEQYLALLLSTNNLSPSNVAGKLDATTFPSGIAMLVEQSEVTGSIQDKQRLFQDAEQDLWIIIQAWQNMLFDKQALTQEFMAAGKLMNARMNLHFNETKPVVTEKDKLDTIQLRKTLGINEQVDLIMIDNPSMSREDAEEKLLAIQKEKVENILSRMVQLQKPITPQPQIEGQMVPKNADIEEEPIEEDPEDSAEDPEEETLM